MAYYNYGIASCLRYIDSDNSLHRCPFAKPIQKTKEKKIKKTRGMYIHRMQLRFRGEGNLKRGVGSERNEGQGGLDEKVKKKEKGKRRKIGVEIGGLYK